MQLEALNNLRRRFDESAARQFLNWWASELAGLLPERVRERVSSGPGQLRVVSGNGELELWLHAEGEQRRIGSVDLEADPAVGRQQFQAVLETISGDPPEMLLAIPADRVLRHTLLLPEAATENLRQVLTFEMDRHTPFNAADVLFDARVVNRHAATGKVAIEVILVRRNDAEPLLEQANSRGIRLAVLDVLSSMDEGGPQLYGVNLLPEDQRARRPNLRLYVNAGLVVLALLLVAMGMWKSLANKERGLELLSAEVAQARQSAVEVSNMRDELNEAVTGANFLIDQRLQRRTTIEILRVLTDLLPDDVWLQRFELQDGTVQIQGEAPNASALINMLEESPVFAQAAFRSPVTRNQDNQKERFSITAELEAPTPEIEEVASQ